MTRRISTWMKAVAVGMVGCGMAVSAVAQETATAEEVYDMVLKGVTVLQQLGDAGLEAFNDPQGEFAWKDTYVQVYNCEALQIPGHINPAVRAFTPERFSTLKDEHGNAICLAICEAAKNPQGQWIEYWWPKAGETEPARKVLFVIQVPDMPYQVSAGIYDEAISVEELNAGLQ
jgi:cytochrome c